MPTEYMSAEEKLEQMTRYSVDLVREMISVKAALNELRDDYGKLFRRCEAAEEEADSLREELADLKHKDPA